MLTPFGPLNQLDLRDPATSLKVLSFDKHQIAEGMIVESLFDQLVNKIPKKIDGHDVAILDVETYVTRAPEKFSDVTAFVWERSSAKAGLGRYLQALEKKFKVVQVRFDDKQQEFFARKILNGSAETEWLLLDSYMLAEGRTKVSEYAVSSTVKHENRQLSAFWGYLSNTWGNQLDKYVALPRLLVNWGISPWYKSVWNVDRILVVGEQVWALEVKHKFPFGNEGKLKFGLNNGEACLIRDLTQCKIKVAHLVVVKPIWSKSVSSLRLLSDFEAKDRALVIGAVWEEKHIRNIISRISNTSGGDTTIPGTGSINYKPIAVDEFCVISSLAKPADGAMAISRLLQGLPCEACSEDHLLRMRMEHVSS